MARIGTSSLGKCIEKVVEGSGWKEKFRKLPYGKGIGLAASAYMTGAGTAIYWNNMPHSGVQLKLDRSGGVCVFCGSSEIGQGSDSILAYITAEMLGIDPVRYPGGHRPTPTSRRWTSAAIPAASR